MSSELAQTPLHSWHAAHGGRLVDFAGWSMPVQYTSITAEHVATRTAVGVFDISHMGRLRFTGERALELLDHVVAREVSKIGPGRIRYALITNESGGILDDVLVYHLSTGAGSSFRMVVNASNRKKILRWLEPHAEQFEVEVVDETFSTAMIAIQGPSAISVAQPLLDVDVAGLKYYTGCEATVCGVQGIVSRTGYTGEDGCEVVVPADDAARIWTNVLESGKDVGAVPSGLGCRDTLRLEAAMPLYGHELSEEINPVQAGLQFAVDLDHEFIGRDAIARFAGDTAQPKRIGLEMEGRRVPRQGYSIHAGDEAAGEVTSGTFSPTLEKPIAMGYVRPDLAEPGIELAVDIRGQRAPAVVVELPFYQRKK